MKLDYYRKYLFTNKVELEKFLSPADIKRIIQVRHLYTYVLENPAMSDRHVVQWYEEVYQLRKSQAYDDLSLVKRLMPLIHTTATREFHRYRYNEMILDTYERAKEEGDLKTMERAASSYARFNKVDKEDLQTIPYDDIVVQPFTATDDPTPLGIKPMKGLRKRINQLLERYGAETADIEDIEFEPADILPVNNNQTPTQNANNIYEFTTPTE